MAHVGKGIGGSTLVLIQFQGEESSDFPSEPTLISRFEGYWGFFF